MDTTRLVEQLLEQEESLQKIVQPLLTWYYKNARPMPWRDNPQPYWVWVSEIMLQQTRVEAVRDYFERFLQALPNPTALAQIEDDQLLKLWEGLGYYNRVRNLKKAAQIVCQEYHAQLPGDYELLKKLPGIGEYTAGAIASIAFQIPVPAVDGNVYRVISRVVGNSADVSLGKVKKAYFELVGKIVPTQKPGDFNQALMELGATVCLPNGYPLCLQCPLQSLCTAQKQKNPLDYPVKPDKKPRTVVKKTVLLIFYKDSVLVHQRENSGLLAGLWEFPCVEHKLKKSELLQQLKELGISPESVEKGISSKHIFSHLEWDMISYQIIAEKNSGLPEDMKWISNFEQTPIPSAFSAFFPIAQTYLQKKEDGI